MASKLIGRADCPECGFKSAHVKRSEKCLYRYCPECGAQHYTRPGRSEELLLQKTRLIELAATGSAASPATDPAPAAPAPAPVAPTTKTAPAKPRGLFTF